MIFSRLLASAAYSYDSSLSAFCEILLPPLLQAENGPIWPPFNHSVPVNREVVIRVFTTLRKEDHLDLYDC